MERKNGTGTSFDVVRFNNAERNADCARNLFFGGVRLWHGLFPLRVADQTKNEEPCSSECVSKGTHRGANPEIVAVICGTGEPHSKNEAEVPFLFRFVSFRFLCLVRFCHRFRVFRNKHVLQKDVMQAGTRYTYYSKSSKYYCIYILLARCYFYIGTQSPVAKIGTIVDRWFGSIPFRSIRCGLRGSFARSLPPFPFTNRPHERTKTWRRSASSVALVSWRQRNTRDPFPDRTR